MANQISDQFQYVGKSFPVQDAWLKVQGEATYTGDMVIPGMHFAKLLFSPIPHGRIVSIDTIKAEALPGVIGVFSHLNAPISAQPHRHTDGAVGACSQLTFNRYRTIPQQELCPEDESLFPETVRYVGDRVAAVVAVTMAIAAEAVKLIQVEYEPLPAVLDPRDSLAGLGAAIHPGGNLLHEYHLEAGKPEVMPEDSITLSSWSRAPKMHHAAMETHVCLADYHPSGKITIYTPCQGAFGVRTIVADLLQMPYRLIRVVKTTMGGSFGGKQEPILEPVAAFLARATRRPVQMIFDRPETMVSTMCKPVTESTITTTAAPDGRLLDCRVDDLFDAGAYATSSVDHAHAMSKKILRLYQIPYYGHRSRTVYTNTPISGGMRGWGAPEIITAMEIHMDRLAKKLALDPAALRAKNLVCPGDLDGVTGMTLGNARIRDCLEKGMISFQWTKRRARTQDEGRFRRGVGLACAAHKNGMYKGFPEYSTMILKMNEDGSVILNTGQHDVGCGTLQAMKLIAAEGLDLDPEMIDVLEADTETGPYDFGCYASRATYIGGACALGAGQKMRQILLQAAGKIFMVPSQHLATDRGTIFIKGAPERRLSYREVATKAAMEFNMELIVTHTHYGTSNPGVYAAHFAEVEVDTCTGLVRVVDYLAVHDVGQAINRMMVEGQIQGGVQMGIGMALCEELKIGADGRTINNSFRKYDVINAPDMPEVKVLLVEEGGDDGPFGAKSVGEIALVPVAAAVVNAVNHALGSDLSDLPLTPQKIIRSIYGVKSSETGVE